MTEKDSKKKSVLVKSVLEVFSGSKVKDLQQLSYISVCDFNIQVLLFEKFVVYLWKGQVNLFVKIFGTSLEVVTRCMNI